MAPPLGGAGGRKAGRTGGACRIGSLALIALALAVTLSAHLFISRSASAAQEGTAAVAASAAHLQTQLERLLKENGDLHGSLAEAQEKLAEADAQLRVARELASHDGAGGVSREACDAAGFAKASCPACVCNCPGKAAAIPGATCACDTYAAAVDPASIDPALRGPLAEGAKSPPLGCAPARGLFENKADKLLFLPPDYCDVDAGTVAGTSPDNDGVSHFERLDPGSVTYNADGLCHWGALYAWKARPDVAMCTHDPAVDTQVRSERAREGGAEAEAEAEARGAARCARLSRGRSYSRERAAHTICRRRWLLPPGVPIFPLPPLLFFPCRCPRRSTPPAAGSSRTSCPRWRRWRAPRSARSCWTLAPTWAPFP
jgi:hypothetical protein